MAKPGITVMSQGLFRFLNRTKKNIAVSGKNTVEELTRAGMYHAKEIAPFRTGRTASMIRKRLTMTNDGSRGIIIAANPTGPGEPRNKPRSYDFNLVSWMHKKKNYKHFKSGKANFMEETAKWLNTIKTRVAMRQLNRIKL